MTRSDYELLSGELRLFYRKLEKLGDEGSSARIEFSRFLSHLCVSLSLENQNFQPAKFRDKVYE